MLLAMIVNRIKVKLALIVVDRVMRAQLAMMVFRIKKKLELTVEDHVQTAVIRYFYFKRNIDVKCFISEIDFYFSITNFLCFIFKCDSLGNGLRALLVWSQTEQSKINWRSFLGRLQARMH